MKRNNQNMMAEVQSQMSHVFNSWFLCPVSNFMLHRFEFSYTTKQTVSYIVRQEYFYLQNSHKCLP